MSSTVGGSDRLNQIPTQDLRDKTATNRAEHKLRSNHLDLDDTLHPGDYGIDYLEVSFMGRRLTHRILQDEPGVIWKPKGYDTPDGFVVTSGWLEIVYNGHSIRLKVMRSERRWRCYLHFNPSRIVDPFGIGLCRPRDLLVVIDKVMVVVTRYIRPFTATTYFKVRRIDIARNFYRIESPIKYLTGLQKVRRPHAKYTKLWGPGDGSLGTLEAGSGSGGECKLYDKHAKSPHLTDPGTMRFEVEARESWAQRMGGIYTVSDLTTAAITKLFRNRMRWFGLEAPVMSMRNAEEEILLNQDLTRQMQDGLIRYLLERKFGLTISVKSQTATKYERRLAELGIAPYQDEAVEKGWTSRLDLQKGTEVRVA